jgi:superfamily II DNA or RNA helicase
MIQLRSYQEPHYVRLLSILQKNGAALDASDTGTGKTVVALFICKALGVVPLVIGPKTSRAGWEHLGKLVGVDMEFVNYEKLRGRRAVDPVAQAAYETARQKWNADFDAAGWPLEFRPEPQPPRAVATTNWVEEVPWGQGSFIRWKNAYALIIFDEAHRCGGATSLNSKLLIAAKRQAQFVLALSATAADDPRQMKALGFALGLHGLSKKAPPSRLNYMSWLMRHGCTPGTFGGFDFSADREKQKKAFERLHGEIFPLHGARIRKAEIPDFPKTVLDIKLLTDDTGKAKKLASALHDANGASALEDTIKCRLGLEKLKVPHLVDLASDYAQTSKVVIFVNFTEPLHMLFDGLRKVFGNDKVGYISGEQAGKKGETERFRYLEQFQANQLDALVCNIQAGGESANMHDPTGQIERTTFISPCESGRQFKQVTGRVNRDGGASSLQFSTYFADTYEETVAERLAQKSFNLDVLNDSDFLC